MRELDLFSQDQPRVLIIEDESDLREAVVAYFTAESMIARGAGTLAEANRWCGQGEFDVLILDLGLPDGDGLEWLEHLPSLGQQGVLILTARSAPAQRLAGLRAGADAYLVKPVTLEELALQAQKLYARLRAGKQADYRTPSASRGYTHSSPSWRLYSMTWALAAPNGRVLQLKHAEKLLLLALVQAAGEVVNKERVIESQGGAAAVYDYRRVETMVRRLRLRCREMLGVDLPVLTIYGRGLAFTEPCEVVDRPGTPSQQLS